MNKTDKSLVLRASDLNNLEYELGSIGDDLKNKGIFIKAVIHAIEADGYSDEDILKILNFVSKA